MGGGSEGDEGTRDQTGRSTIDGVRRTMPDRWNWRRRAKETECEGRRSDDTRRREHEIRNGREVFRERYIEIMAVIRFKVGAVDI